ncbi:MAG: hypothetical protein OJJ54_16095 [Pseudonocardia sp.]|nr:hypothetical protein [Pseudonocardia sp.]
MRRLPFTSAIVVVMLVVGVATRALWRPAEDASWYPAVAYGLPSFAEDRWWTLLTGPFLAIVPLAYLAMTGSFALFVGAAEWVLGTRRAAVVAVVGQVGAVLLSAGILLALREVWDWAAAVGTLIDVGFSAGSMASIALISALLRPPWRLRARLVIALYVVGSFVFLGSLADLEHLVAGGLVLAAAPWLDRRMHGPPARPTSARERTRLGLCALGVAVLAGLALGRFLPAAGPVGDTAHAGAMWTGIAVTTLGAPVLAGALRRRG